MRRPIRTIAFIAVVGLPQISTAAPLTLQQMAGQTSATASAAAAMAAAAARVKSMNEMRLPSRQVANIQAAKPKNTNAGADANTMTMQTVMSRRQDAMQQAANRMNALSAMARNGNVMQVTRPVFGRRTSAPSTAASVSTRETNSPNAQLNMMKMQSQITSRQNAVQQASNIMNALSATNKNIMRNVR